MIGINVSKQPFKLNKSINEVAECREVVEW